MLPEGMQIDKLLRAQIAVILFIAAYMAEIVRSGLQSVPRGQSEAAEALGLHWWAVTRLVVLPQALRVSVPPFVNLAIGLFLDTTLVTVIGLLDFLNTAKTAASDPNWVAFFNEGFFVTALVYFAICFGGSRYSLWLERYLHQGMRRTAAR
jgi:general L-amino acid transport system permease protein